MSWKLEDMHNFDDLEKQDLILMLGAEWQKKSDKSDYKVPKQYALRLLHFVCMNLYADNFEGEGGEKYRIYVENLYHHLADGLPNLVPLNLIRSKA